MTDIVYLIEPGSERAVDIPPVKALFYEDGTIRIWHHCRVIDGTQIVCAPALQLDGGHVVVSEDPLTIAPSILCPDCGLHGFITNGAWT